MKNFLLIMIIIGILASTRDLVSLIYIKDYLSKSGAMLGMQRVSIPLLSVAYLVGIPIIIKYGAWPFKKPFVVCTVGLLLDSLLKLFSPLSLVSRIGGNIIVMITSGFVIFELKRLSRKH